MRSLLFVPGDSERKLAKVLSAGADAVLVDLEDSVSEARKASARARAAEWIGHVRASQMDGAAIATGLIVRINALNSEHWEDDLRTIVPCRPDGILLPKSLNGEDVHRLSVLLGTLEEAHDQPIGSTRILVLASETAGSVLALPTYIGASSRLIGLAWGAEDLSAEVGSTAVRDETGAWTSPYRLVRDLVLFTAAAAGIAAIDTVYTDIRNLAGLEREAAAARRDGFTGKMALHPDQVAIINAAFTPSAAEIARAHTIVALFAGDPQAGVLTLDGEMIDRPHLERAKRLLARLAGS